MAEVYLCVGALGTTRAAIGKEKLELELSKYKTLYCDIYHQLCGLVDQLNKGEKCVLNVAGRHVTVRRNEPKVKES